MNDEAVLLESTMPYNFSLKISPWLMTLLLEVYHPVYHDLAPLKHMMGPSSEK
jgi:hypothetical protein